MLQKSFSLADGSCWQAEVPMGTDGHPARHVRVCPANALASRIFTETNDAQDAERFRPIMQAAIDVLYRAAVPALPVPQIQAAPVPVPPVKPLQAGIDFILDAAEDALNNIDPQIPAGRSAEGEQLLRQVAADLQALPVQSLELDQAHRLLALTRRAKLYLGAYQYDQP